MHVARPVMGTTVTIEARNLSPRFKLDGDVAASETASARGISPPLTGSG